MKDTRAESFHPRTSDIKERILCQPECMIRAVHARHVRPLAIVALCSLKSHYRTVSRLNRERFSGMYQCISGLRNVNQVRVPARKSGLEN